MIAIAVALFYSFGKDNGFLYRAVGCIRIRMRMRM
jgi:hypothetical protein